MEGKNKLKSNPTSFQGNDKITHYCYVCVKSWSRFPLEDLFGRKRAYLQNKNSETEDEEDGDEDDEDGPDEDEDGDDEGVLGVIS